MAEEGWTENEIAKLAIQEYLKGFADIDCLVLGCTHYPLFKHFIQEKLGNDKDIINTGEILSKELNALLKVNGIQNQTDYKGDYSIYLTDMEENFINVAEKLLKKEDIKNIIKIADI